MKLAIVPLTASLLLTCALATPASAQLFGAPTITAIASPLPGVIEITFTTAAGDPRQPVALYLYRRDGEHSVAERFELLKRNGYPHRFMDTLGSPEFTREGATLTLVASGLKSGLHSFYITRMNGGVHDVEESAPSNVMSVIVTGSLATDGVIGGSLKEAPATAFAEPIEIVGIGCYPNPASSTLLLEHATQAASMRIVDGRGDVIVARALDGDVRSLDVSSLAPGIYQLELLDRERVARTRFIVVR